MGDVRDVGLLGRFIVTLYTNYLASPYPKNERISDVSLVMTSGDETVSLFFNKYNDREVGYALYKEGKMIKEEVVYNIPLEFPAFKLEAERIEEKLRESLIASITKVYGREKLREIIGETQGNNLSLIFY